MEVKQSARFDGKVAIITGAASGIGAATARRFASEGARVVVADIRDDAGEEVVASIRRVGGLATFCHCDVSQLAHWQNLARVTHDTYGRIDIIHNNAFFLVLNAIEEQAEADWDRQLQVCLKQVYNSMRACGRALIDAHGAVINTSSVHALVGSAGYSAYAASKGGMCALTRQLAVEYAPHVRVNAVLPGFINTPVNASLSPDEIERYRGHIPLQRFGEPDEIAAMVAFLASDDSLYITGTALVVDGGLTAAFGWEQFDLSQG